MRFKSCMEPVRDTCSLSMVPQRVEDLIQTLRYICHPDRLQRRYICHPDRLQRTFWRVRDIFKGHPDRLKRKLRMGVWGPVRGWGYGARYGDGGMGPGMGMGVWGPVWRGNNLT